MESNPDILNSDIHSAPTTYEPQMAQRDQNLIDEAMSFCLEYTEVKNDEGVVFKVPTGKVRYPDIKYEVEHLYSQLVNTSHLNTNQLIVVLCDWVLSFNMMEVKYLAKHDYNAVSFLQSMNKFIEIQLMGGAHEGMRAKYVSSLVGSDRRLTVSQEKQNTGVLGRFR